MAGGFGDEELEKEMSECDHKTWSDYMKAHGKEEYDLEEAYYTRLERELALLYRALDQITKESGSYHLGNGKMSVLELGPMLEPSEQAVLNARTALASCPTAAKLAKES